jgi:hypothetical protein
VVDERRCLVHFSTEDGRASRDFDFARLPVSRALQVAFAKAFDRLTGPSGTRKAKASALDSYQLLGSFARFLATVGAPPQAPGGLLPSHLAAYTLQGGHRRCFPQQLGMLKRTLRAVEGLSGAFAAKLSEPGPPRDRTATQHSYTQDEFKRILAVARRDARASAARIRAHRELLQRWRAGGIDPGTDFATWELGKLLDHIERIGDVPRYDTERRHPQPMVPRHGGTSELIGLIHLPWQEAAAFVVLLVGLTGQNGGTVADAPAAHHRADGQAGGTPTAIVELVKPRRGKHRSHMDVPLVDLPDWLSAGDSSVHPSLGKDALHTAFGVYMLLVELTEPARRIAGTDRLLVGWGRLGFQVGTGSGSAAVGAAVASWARRSNLTADVARPGADPEPLKLTLPRLRLSSLEHHQQAVAHTERVLANEYLGRDRGNVVEYQRLVARVLEEQVAKAKASRLLPTLSEVDVAEAREDPAAVASRYGLAAAVLTRLLAGELDTVMAGCVDHTNSPYAPAGEACRASFMRCLDCPCARATPRHLPIQLLVLDALEARRLELAPMTWARRFALPHGQLAELVGRFPPATVEAARVAATDADRRLVTRFLARELDRA